MIHYNDDKRLYVTCNGEDVSAECHLGKGKGNPFGWSTAELVHKRWVGGTQVEVVFGSHYCGDITVTDPAYAFEIVENGGAA